jgi:hypothetical protein
VLVVVDRANTVEEDRGMYLRFRSPGHFALDGDVATASVGSTKLTVSSLARTSGTLAIGVPTAKDCFAPGTVRGTCDAARFPVTDVRTRLSGPRASAAHAIAVVDHAATSPAASALNGDGWHGIHVAGPRDAVVVWRELGARGDTFGYRAAAAAKVTHVIIDGPEQDGLATVTAKRDADACVVTVAAGGVTPARPLIVTLDDHCTLTDDPQTDAVPTARQHRGSSHGGARSPRAGCCGAQTAPASPLALAFVVLALALRRRRAATT